MKRRDEFIVGVTIILFLALLVGGTLWLSEQQFLGRAGVLRSARFRTVGGLSVGNPVILRGVRVGRVQELRLGEGTWVETVLQINADVILPSSPGIIAASASLFGEWQASIVNLDELDFDDPNVRRELEAAAAEGDDAWPGATLPDIGQLTAQAGRIATDIATFSSRIETAFDQEAVEHLQQSIRDFGAMSDRINEFADEQTEVLGGVSENVLATSVVVTEVAESFRRTVARIDTATGEGRMDTLMTNAAEVSSDLRLAVAGFRELLAVITGRSENFERIILGADSVVARLQTGDGTIGRLVADSTLYVEASRAVEEFRELISDIRANPRKYFKFSVF